MITKVNFDFYDFSLYYIKNNILKFISRLYMNFKIFLYLLKIHDISDDHSFFVIYRKQSIAFLRFRCNIGIFVAIMPRMATKSAKKLELFYNDKIPSIDGSKSSGR